MLSAPRGLTVTNVGNDPAVRIRPSADNGPAEIYFSRRGDGSGVNAGDNWIVGVDAYGAGDGVFTIATAGRLVVLSINPDTGRTTFNYPIQATQVVARGVGSGGTVRAVPLSSSGESSIGFYRNENQSISATGDEWVLGHNVHGAGPGNFAIGVNNLGSRLTINSLTGIIDVKALTINAQPVATEPWIAGRCRILPSLADLMSNGRRNYTFQRVQNAPTGVFVVSWPDPHPNNNNYGVIVTLSQNTAYYSYHTVTSTSFRISVNSVFNGFPQDPDDLTFMTIP
jgi:hypothetical protein